MFHTLFCIFLSWLLLRADPSQQKQLVIPNPFSYDSPQSWTIRSTCFTGSQSNESSLVLGEEHYLFDGQNTTYHGYFSSHLKRNILLSRNGKIYEVVESPNEVENDESHQRCSPLNSLIKFPWRYQSRLDKGFLVLGIGALWLNALEMKESFVCSQSIDEEIKCIMKLKLTYMELNFRNSYLISGYVEDKRENDSKLTPSKIEFQVEVLKDYAQEKALDKIGRLLSLCELTSDIKFPRLLSEMVDSRFWSLSYVVQNFDPNTGNKQNLYSIREELNYESAFQALTKYAELQGTEMYFRNMSLHWTFDGMLRTMTYKIEKKICRFNQFEDEILNGDYQVHSTKRKVHFKNGKSGYLIGLSALLMNMADIRNKRVAVEGTSIQNKWHIEWIFSDGSEFQWHLNFPSSAYEKGPALVDQWSILELRQISKKGGKGPLVASFLRVDEIWELAEIPTIQTLELLDGCPSATDFILQDQQDEKIPDVEIDSNQKQDADGEEVQKFEFPSFNQALNLEESYLLVSEWDFNNGTTIHLTERQLLQIEKDQDDGELLSRFDVIRQDGRMDPSIYTLFIKHASGAIIRAKSTGCIQVSSPDAWIRLNELDEPDFNHTSIKIKIDNWTPKPVGFYGVSALWKQAELSSSLEFIYGTQSWQLNLGDNKATVMFNFTIDEVTNKPKLSCMEIDTSRLPEIFENVKKISIKLTKFEPIPPSGLHFVLPAHCDGKVMNESHYPSPKFRFPEFKDRFNGPPALVPFRLVYQIIALVDGAKKIGSVKELYNPYSGVGLFNLRFLNGSLINFWTDSSHHTWIDWNKACKTSGDITQLFEIEDWLFKDNELLGANSSNFLLAKTWQIISARVSPSYIPQPGDEIELSVRSRQHMLNKNFQPVIIDWILKNPRSDLSIKFSFMNSDPSTIPALQSVYYLTDKDEVKLHIRVASISNQVEQISLPERCVNELAFPKLSELVPDKSKHFLHLRSEFSSDQSFEDGVSRQLFMMDEWLYMSESSYFTYRLTTSNLENEKDYLIISQTGELFDLSKRVENVFKCETINLGPGIDDSAIWIQDRLLGPMWVWLMAEKNPYRVKVIKSVEKLTLPDILGFSDLDISRWMNCHVWKVKSAYSDKEYTLHFNLVPEVIDGLLELDRIDFWQNFHPLSYIPQKVLVQVVSLAQKSLQDQTVSDRLVIPKSRGCRRNSFAKQDKIGKLRDVIGFQTTSPSTFRYYSYLKLANYKSNTLVLQPLVYEGSLSLCPAVWYTLPICNIKINHQRAIPLNGSQPIIFRQIVSQESSSGAKIINTLDEVSGHCTIKSHEEEEGELLKFSFELPAEQQIRLNSNFLESLLSCKGNDLIQSRDGVARVYERDWQDINFTSTLSGPAIVTQTFDLTTKTKYTTYGSMSYHNDVNIEIFWPNRGLMYFGIYNSVFKECNDILKEDAQIEDCIQTSEMVPKQKIRYFRFRIVYNGEQIQDKGLINLERSIEGNVKNSLLSHFKGRLIPTQLGRTLVVLDKQEVLTAELCISFIEPPEPIEYFQVVENQKLSSQPPVGMKYIQNEFGCSDWCASNECRAFSYCPMSRLCEIVERFDQNQKNPNGVASEQGCQLWKAPKGTLRLPIRVLMDELEQDVANNRFSINWSAFGVRLEVVHMKELNGILEQEDELQQQQQPENYSSKQEVFSFVSVKPNAKLILTEENSNQFKDTRELKLVDCMRSCFDSGCQLFSYCSDDQACTMLVNLDNYSSYSTNITAALTIRSCSTYGEDFLANYQHFSETSQPNSSKFNISDVSLQECASRCELSGDLAFACVAFDYCYLKLSNLEEPRPICYLQALHVSMEDFDESVLFKPELPATKDDYVVCSHYSSTFMRDFRPNPNRRFEKHSSITYNLDLHRCAMICRAHSKTCLAFEHCHSNMSIQDTCFVHHIQQEQASANSSNCSNSASPNDTCYSEIKLGPQNSLLPSDNCTVYQYRWQTSHHLSVELDDNKSDSLPKPGEIIVEPNAEPIWLLLLRTTIYTVIALLVGLIVQIAYIRLVTFYY